MVELKTRETVASVNAFIKNVDNEQRRKDCVELLALMKKVTNKQPKMWGESIVGFGRYHYKYASGREGDWFVTGFSPRKQDLTVYILPGFSQYSELMGKIGAHKVGKSCLYIKKLSDINIKVLESLVRQSVKDMKNLYHCT